MECKWLNEDGICRGRGGESVVGPPKMCPFSDCFRNQCRFYKERKSGLMKD